MSNYANMDNYVPTFDSIFFGCPFIHFRKLLYISSQKKPNFTEKMGILNSLQFFRWYEQIASCGLYTVRYKHNKRFSVKQIVDKNIQFLLPKNRKKWFWFFSFSFSLWIYRAYDWNAFFVVIKSTTKLYRCSKQIRNRALV